MPVPQPEDPPREWVRDRSSRGGRGRGENTKPQAPDSKHQIPNTKLQKNFKLQIPKKRPCFAVARNITFLACLALTLIGCTTSPPAVPGAGRFHFEQDTFAYANQLVWEYRFDEQGKWTSKPREPKPEYTHHCFVVARAAKQFFTHARFDPDRPAADAKTYRRLIRKVASTSPHRNLPDDEKIVIPGYANLREFSVAQERLLKAECGGAWRSYFQHGHWRMIWPFTRRHQDKTAEELVNDLKQNRPPVVHLVRFPSLTINHAVLLFDCIETGPEIRFATYDPNSPAAPVTLTYNRAARTFSLPTNFYFPGGRVDVYEIYRSWCY